MEKECGALRVARLLPPKSKDVRAADTYVMSID